MWVGGDRNLAERTADHAGRYEAEGVDMTGQANRLALRLGIEGAAVSDRGHRVSLRRTTGFDNCLNLLVACLSPIDSSRPDNCYPTHTRLRQLSCTPIRRLSDRLSGMIIGGRDYR